MIYLNKKSIYIVVAVLVVVLVIAVAAYVFLYQPGGSTTNPTPTPTPAPVAVADAASVQFAVDVTSDGATNTVQYFARGLQGSDIDMRVEIDAGDAGTLVYIFNGAAHQAWANDTGTWTDVSSAFATNWDQWYPGFEGYIDNLAHWTTGEFTSEDGTVRIYEIVVNPTLDDALFAAPT